MFSRSKLFSIACLCIGLTVSSSGCSTLNTLPRGESSPLIAENSDQSSLENFSTKKTRQLRIDTAQRLVTAGHSKEAIALYLQAEQEAPTKPKFDRELAPLLAELGQSEEALKRYRNAIQQSPADSELRVNYAWTLIELNQLSQATTELQRVANTDPSHSGAMNALAVCNFRQGNANAAYEQFKKLHGAAAARHNMALLYIENEQVDVAKQWIEESMHDNPLPQTEKLASLLFNTNAGVALKTR